MARIRFIQEWHGYKKDDEINVASLMEHYLVDTYKVAVLIDNAPAEVPSTSAKMQAKPKRNKMLRRPASAKTK